MTQEGPKGSDAAGGATLECKRQLVHLWDYLLLQHRDTMGSIDVSVIRSGSNYIYYSFFLYF